MACLPSRSRRKTRGLRIQNKEGRLSPKEQLKGTYKFGLLIVGNDIRIIILFIVMKKFTNTLPSTKPDHLYSSQPSQSSFHTTKSRNYQQQFTTLIASLKAVHRFRYYLLFRDLETIYKQNELLLNDLLQVTSAQQLWQLFVPRKQEQLRQQQQINLLLRMLLELNARKHKEADNGNIRVFDQYRITIDWFIQQIVTFQSEVRIKIEQKILQSCENEKKKRQSQFSRYQYRMRQQFEALESIRKENLYDRLQREAQMSNIEILDKINTNMHKIRASSQLKDVKDTTLLRKLAPYRWEKKRPYEDDTYHNQINKTVEMDQERRLRVIQNMKRVQKERLRKAHQTLISTQDMHAESMRDKLFIHLSNQKSELKNHQERALRNLRHSVDMANNLRVSSLKKSLQAFARHQDTLKIKEIMNDHHLKVQFNNTIEEVAQPQANVREMDSRYCTINTDRACLKVEKAVDRHQRRLKKRINVIIGDEAAKEVVFSGRKSLVDLYDKSLNPLS